MQSQNDVEESNQFRWCWAERVRVCARNRFHRKTLSVHTVNVQQTHVAVCEREKTQQQHLCPLTFDYSVFSHSMFGFIWSNDNSFSVHQWWQQQRQRLQQHQWSNMCIYIHCTKCGIFLESSNMGGSNGKKCYRLNGLRLYEWIQWNDVKIFVYPSAARINHCCSLIQIKISADCRGGSNTYTITHRERDVSVQRLFLSLFWYVRRTLPSMPI